MDSTSALVEQLTILISGQITQRNKIDRLRADLTNSQKIIDQKDEVIDDLIDQHKDETERLEATIDELDEHKQGFDAYTDYLINQHKAEINKLEATIDDLNKVIDQLERDIGCM